ncbi:MAG: glycoside hydrolase family 97 C-terminal domain-containing protein, partial [Porticoccaceae bacterium]|nr:glycoside hydrolase family 97 C-terminal domain-containing protein [Porticoccaceae bacterium]
EKGTTISHALQIPFIRALAGPMDYTPGATVNVREADYFESFHRPVSQGTRTQQLAMYVIYYGPLQMLADAPTSYEAEADMLDFLSAVPTTWDESIPLKGKVGELAVVARRKGQHWYVGGMTRESNQLELDFSFLPPGKWRASIYEDGVNADVVGEDYLRTDLIVTHKDKRAIKMVSGGGFAMKLTPATKGN